MLESPQSLYTICRLYIKEDILCSDQGSIPKEKCQTHPFKVALSSPASMLTCQSSAACRPRPPMAAASTPFKNGSTCPAPFLPHVVHNPSPCSTELPRHSLLASPLLCALLAAPTPWVTCGAPWTSCPSPPLPNFMSLSFSFVSVESIPPFFRAKPSPEPPGWGHRRPLA